MLEVIIFIVICLIFVVSLLGAILWGIGLGICKYRKKDGGKAAKRGKRCLLVLAVACIINGGFVWITQLTVATPDINNGKGNMKESIAEVTAVDLNGRKEWISIRGEDKENPVLLFLAGGPGGSQMAAVRHELGELEKHFTVVSWDQPGAAKSYGAMEIKDITTDTYIEDGYALTKYLCEKFDQEKIYLIGESWGSALGIFLIDKAPELYEAFIGTGQMVDFKETEIIDYEKALELAEDEGDNKTVDKLKANGRPPYYGKNVTMKSAVYLQYLTKVMGRNQEIHNNGYQTMRDLFSDEYGLWDKVNYFRGILTTFNHVYQQLYDIDLREDYDHLEVPVYFFLGRHDINAPLSLAEEYFEILDAPKKEIVWFEHSGHSPWINESDKFIEELVKMKKMFTEFSNL